jgi:branched-chain amino acid transport system substrate-binding protein
VNAQGGIKGHPVQVVIADDTGDPATAQAAEKKLVDSDTVLALVIGSDNLVTAYDDAAIRAGVAVVGGTSNVGDWYTKAGMFPTMTDIVSGLKAQVAVAKQYGKATTFGQLYCAEVAACAQAIPILKAATSAAGIGYVPLAVSSTTPSYTAQCLSLKQQKVDFAQLNFTTAAAVKFIQDCQAQGYNPTWGSSEQALGKDYLSIPANTVYGPAFAFPSVADAPAVQTFRDAMNKYAKDSNWKEGTASFAWQGLEAVRKALANVGATPTRQDVLDGLYSFKDENLGGLLANKISFTLGKPNGPGSQPCYFVVGVENGKTTAPNGLTPVCPTS